MQSSGSENNAGATLSDIYVSRASGDCHAESSTLGNETKKKQEGNRVSATKSLLISDVSAHDDAQDKKSSSGKEDHHDSFGLSVLMNSSHQLSRAKMQLLQKRGSPEAERLNVGGLEESVTQSGNRRPNLTKLLNSSIRGADVDSKLNSFITKMNSLRKIDEDTVPLARSPREILKERDIHLAEVTVDRDELRTLMMATNFCKREIVAFYTYFGFMANTHCYEEEEDIFCENEANSSTKHPIGGTVDKTEFEALFEDAGLRQTGFRTRLWNFFNGQKSDTGGITEFEIVTGLNPILRGKIEDVASMFFDLYDLNDNGNLSADEIIAAYSDMVVRETDGDSARLLSGRRRRTSMFDNFARFAPAHTAVKTRRRSTMSASEMRTVMTAEIGLGKDWGMKLKRNPPLSENERNNVIEWVEHQRQTNGGVLNKDTFVKGVVNEFEKMKTDSKSSCISWRDATYVLLLGCFELGPLFMLLTLSALPNGFMDRLDITETEIGILNTVYFVAGMVSPLVGGLLLDKYGPAGATLVANAITTTGAVFQLAASSPSLFPLLIIARFLNGFGLEITFVTTNECYIQLFPSNAGLMVGVHSFFINFIFFAAFAVLPILGNIGMDIALLITVFLCVVSTLSTIAIIFLQRRDKKAKQDNTDSDKTRLLQTFAALGTVMTPHEPRGCHKWKLPLSFFGVVMGNKAIGYFFNTFSVFSTTYFSRNFSGITEDFASLLTGLTGLFVGVCAPLLGAAMDKYGKRSLMLASASGLGLVGFFVLMVGDSKYLVFIFCALFTIVAAYQDLAVAMISFVVGPSQLGTGYGAYGILGNGIDAAVSFFAGYLIGNGKDVAFTWFSAMFMLTGIIGWGVVYLLERKRSFSEVPLSGIIETCEEDLYLASLASVIHAPVDKENRVVEVAGASESRTLDMIPEE